MNPKDVRLDATGQDCNLGVGGYFAFVVAIAMSFF